MRQSAVMRRLATVLASTVLLWAASPLPRTTFHAKPKPLPAGARVQNWKGFLGPEANMVSGETKLVGDFSSEAPPLVWEREKGTGYSAPAISGDQLVFLHRMGGEEIIESLRAETGERLWEVRYPSGFSDRYGYNNGPRASPVIDGGRVYTYGAEGLLHCLDLASGEVLWKRDVAKEYGVPQDFFGTASTPLIEDDLLILNVGAPGGPTVAALDKISGEQAWGAGKEWGPSYASPVPALIHDQRRVLVFAGGESRPPTGGLLSIDPATGAIDFAFPWRSQSYESVNASTPLILDDRVLISATYRTGAAMLRIKPDFTYEKLWSSDDLDLHWTSAVFHEGHLYAFAGRNEPDAGLVCVRAATGEMVWRNVIEWKERIEWNGQSREIYESPYRGWIMKVDGRFLALGEHGHLLWLDLSPAGVEVASRTRLFLARESWTPPVLSRGLLYVAQNTRSLHGDPPRLLCYDLRGE